MTPPAHVIPRNKSLVQDRASEYKMRNLKQISRLHIVWVVGSNMVNRLGGGRHVMVARIVLSE